MGTSIINAARKSGSPTLDFLREEVAGWHAIASGASRIRYAEVPNRFIFVDHIGRIGVVSQSGFGGVEFVDADPDLVGVDIGPLELAKAGAKLAGSDKVIVLDVIDYARARAERAQTELDRLVERLEKHRSNGEIAGSRPAEAGALSERELDARDDANLRARVLAAVVREMGLAAPPEGSKSRDELADRLFHAVSAHSLARVELLSDRLRSLLHEAYYQSENDAGAYGAAWRREIVKNGKRGLADESDAALLERVMINVGHDYLVGSDGTWFGDREGEFLAVMAQASQVEMMRSAIVEELHDFPRETAEALGQRYVALGLSDPY